MKQVLSTKNSLAPHSPLHHSINQKRVYFQYLFILVAGFAMLMTSCQKEALQGNAQQQNALNSSQKQGIQDINKTCVPFKAAFETLDKGASDSTHEQINGTGEGTVIGKSTFVAFVYFVNFPLLSGTSTIITAKGDKIYTTFSGKQAGPNQQNFIKITNNNTITGGTGRFKGATGSFVALGIANTNFPTGFMKFEGTICY